MGSTRPGENKFLLLMVVLYTITSLTFSLFIRYYVFAFYTTAYIAAWTVIVGLFLVAHHMSWIRKTLHFSDNLHCKIRLLFNVVHLLAWYICAVLYSVITAKTHHINYDFLGAAILSWVNAFIVAYLTVACIRILVDEKCSYNYSNRPALKPSDGASVFRPQKKFLVWFDNEAMITNTSSSKEGKYTVFCKTKFFRAVYLMVHICLMFFMSLSIYYPLGVLGDFQYNWPEKYMYTVNVGNHQPLALFIRCQGQGQETIIFENGLGGLGYFYWEFAPTSLAKLNYTVCIHDRRGYGWSEGTNYDRPWLYFQGDPQMAETNVDYLKALVDVAKIQKPFYYVGHSYGSHHLTFMALKYPEYVKGLVFLDGDVEARIEHHNEGNKMRDLTVLFHMIAQFQPTSIIRIAFDYQLSTVKKYLGYLVRFDEISIETQKDLVIAIRSGDFFAASYQEFFTLAQKKTALQAYKDALKGGVIISTPALSIDAGNQSDYLSMVNFPNLMQKTVPDADHTSIVLSKEFSSTITMMIDQFIKNNP